MKKLLIYTMIIILSILFLRCKSDTINTELSFVAFEYEMPFQSNRFPQKYPLEVKVKYILNVHNLTTDTLRVSDLLFYETINKHRGQLHIDTSFSQLKIHPCDSLWIGVYSNKIYQIDQYKDSYKADLNSSFRRNNKNVELLFEYDKHLSTIENKDNIHLYHSQIDAYSKKYINRPSVFWLGIKDQRVDTNSLYYLDMKKHTDNKYKMNLKK